MEFEELLSGAAQFNKHKGLGSFPFSNFIFLAFVDSLVSATVTGRNMEPSQPDAPCLQCDILAHVEGRVSVERRG